LAVGDRVQRFAVPSGPEQATLARPGFRIDALASSADGQLLAAAVRNQMVGWWDIISTETDPAIYRRKGTWEPRDLYVACLAWSHDGTVLAAGGGTIDPDAKRDEAFKHSGHDLRFFYPARRVGHFTSFRGNGATVTAIAFSPNGKFF